jgi:histidinol dehydrogenase
MTAPYALDTAPGVRCERILRPIRASACTCPRACAAAVDGADARRCRRSWPAAERGAVHAAARDGSADPAVL